MVVSYSGSTPTVEYYYPFGSVFSDDNVDKNKYLYNGKELNKEFFENYDYGARFYDPNWEGGTLLTPKLKITNLILLITFQETIP